MVIFKNATPSGPDPAFPVALRFALRQDFGYRAYGVRESRRSMTIE